jgi:hypothetical protein
MRRASLLVACVVGLLACEGPAEPRLEPPSGRQGGGEHVRIVGRNFAGRGPVVVYVGTRAAKGVVIESDELITVVTPQSEALGPVPVRLEFRDGTTFDLVDGFTYVEQPGIVLQPEVGFGPAGRG